LISPDDNLQLLQLESEESDNIQQNSEPETLAMKRLEFYNIVYKLTKFFFSKSCDK